MSAHSPYAYMGFLWLDPKNMIGSFVNPHDQLYRKLETKFKRTNYYNNSAIVLEAITENNV